MLVVAKVRGEYPQGTWRNPGEKFEFDGEKPALWMMTAEEAGKSKAEDNAKAEEYAEIAKAQSDAGEKAKADIAARKEGDKPPAKAVAEDTPKEFYSKHRGAGKYDVFGSDGNVVEGGNDLNKANAGALVELLLNKEA